MDRMIRELEGKSTLPSETTVPAPTLPPSSEGMVVEVAPPKDDTARKSPAGPCPPKWWKRGDTQGFIEGIGASDVSQKVAEGDARLDVAKTLEVNIAGADTMEQQETTGGKFSYSVQSSIVERVDLSLAGLTIQNSSSCHNRWYAQAKLNRTKAETAWRTDLNALDSQAEAIRTQIATHQQKGEAFALLLAHYRLMIVEETVSQIQHRLPRLTGKKESVPSRAGEVKQAQANYESLLGSLQVKTVGDAQQAVTGPQLPNPLEVQVLAGDVPVPRV